MNSPESDTLIRRHVAEIALLAEACRNGDIRKVRRLLQKHPDVLDSPDRDTRFPYPGSQLWSPLWLAARNGHEKLVALLLAMGANPVPFEFAARYHHLTFEDWTDELRERGYDSIADLIETAISNRYGPLLDDSNLHQAIRAGDTGTVQMLLSDNPDRVRQVDRVGNTPLHLAVGTKNVELVRLLVENGAPLDARNGDGRTPAVVALFGFHRWWRNQESPGILRYLLDRGAEYTMLIAATVGDEARVRELLRTDPALANEPEACLRRPLSAAVEKGHASIVRLLLENGADPNAKEAVCQGGLSLYTAAWQGDIEMVRLLLDYGAVPNHWLDSSGDAVFAAYQNGHKEILQKLYAHGGTLEIAVYAAHHRIDVIAEILHRNPAEADSVLPYGWESDENAPRGLPRASEDLAYDIMQLAIRYGARFENASAWNLRWTVSQYPKVFRLLHEHGADANQPLLGISGDMPRRWPDPDHQRRTIAFLVETCGADVNCRDEEGFTPLALASREGYGLLVEYFLSKGAGVNPDAPSWAKPLYLARKNAHEDITNLLLAHGAVT